MRSGVNRADRFNQDRRTGGRLIVRLSLAGILSYGIPAASESIAAPDSSFQCIPSGFTIGIPPFHVSHGIQERYGSILLHLEPLQDELAEVLSNSGLFSNVALLREVPRPDSTDLTLLVSLSRIREVEGSGGSNFEISFSVLLTENRGGWALFQETYFQQIRGRYSPVVPQGVGPSVEVETAFPVIATRITRDLNIILNKSSDPTISALQASRTVTHASLAEMRILRPIVANAGVGLGNYSQYIDENLREKLYRKDCFLITALPDHVAQCLEDSLNAAGRMALESLTHCLADSSWQGFLLVNWITPVSDSLRVRSVLVTVPEMDVAYDKSLTTITGWRLGNTLEQLAAGIAQASHGWAY